MPKIFGIEHLLYVAIFFVIALATTILFKKFLKNESSIKVMIKVIAGLLLVWQIINRLSVCFMRNGGSLKMALPNSFCSLSGIVLALAVLFGKKDSKIFNFIVYVAFIGGLLTIIYPDFVDQSNSIFYLPTISGLLYHTLMLWLSILLVMFKWFTPTLKKWYFLPLGLCCFMTYGLFLKDALGVGAMYIGTPLISGTIFTWYFVGLLVLLLSYAIMLTFDLVHRAFKKDNNLRFEEVIGKKE